MALLTAEDVLNKAFSKTKYREGFDQDEVDDFLDEIATTIASLTAERDQLAAQLAQGGGAIAATGAYGATGAIPAATDGGSLLAAATDPNPPSAPSMIAMAQKLHDEYVSAGEAEKEQILADARMEASQLLATAQEVARDKMVSLEGERVELEGKIDDLRRFERDYRGHLKSYLENLLGDIEHGEQRATGAIPLASAAATTPVSTPDAAPETTPTSQPVAAAWGVPSEPVAVVQDASGPGTAAEVPSEPVAAPVPSDESTGAVQVASEPVAAVEVPSEPVAAPVPSDETTGAVPQQATTGITPMPQWPTS